MGDIGHGMKKLIDAMTTVSLHNTAIAALCMLFDHVARISKEHAGFDDLYRFVQTLSRGLHHTDRPWICSGLLANVICFVEITVKAFVVN